MAAAILASGGAFANRGGVAVVHNDGCNACHIGGVAPVVTISTVSTGATSLDLAVSVTTPNGVNAGFNLSASNGTLSNAGAGVKIVAGNATHTLPKASEPSDEAIFTASWNNPAPTHPLTFTAWGNSVDGDLNTTGDRASSTTLVCSVWFQDPDGDGFGTGPPTIECPQSQPPPLGTAAQGGDCDETDPALHPGATETCNLVDDDCDGSVDEAGGEVWFTDADGDGFGDPGTASTACEQPANAVADGSDCNDTSPSIRPGAAEVCNGVDDDCNAVIDDAEQSCDAPPPDAGPLTNGEHVDEGTGTGGTADPSESGAGCAAMGPGSAEGLWVAALLVGLRERSR